MVANIAETGVAAFADIRPRSSPIATSTIYGAAARVREHFGCRLVMHERDAGIVERGDNRLTAAFCFDDRLRAPCRST